MLHKVKKSQATFEVNIFAIEAINREEHRIDISKYNGVMPSTIHKWGTKYKDSQGKIVNLLK